MTLNAWQSEVIDPRLKAILLHSIVRVDVFVLRFFNYKINCIFEITSQFDNNLLHHYIIHGKAGPLYPILRFLNS